MNTARGAGPPAGPAGEGLSTHRIAGRRLTPAALLLAAIYVGLVGVWIGIGFLLTGPLARTAIGRADQNVAHWFVAHRTPGWDGWAAIGSTLSQTLVKVIVTVVVSVVLFIALRSWREPLFVCAATVLEGFVFLTVTTVVNRPRPEVPQLDPVSLGSSFPSGHTAAAAVYCAAAYIVFERTHKRWIRTVAVVLAVALPAIVASSRMYEGVHYLTDVLGGIALGFVSVAATYAVIRLYVGPPMPRDDRTPSTPFAQ